MSQNPSPPSHEPAPPGADEVRQRIRQFVQQQFPAARKGLSDSDSLLKPGIIDSLGTLEIVTFLESEFQVQLTDEEMLSEHFESIDSLTQLVLSKVA